MLNDFDCASILKILTPDICSNLLSNYKIDSDIFTQLLRNWNEVNELAFKAGIERVASVPDEIVNELLSCKLITKEGKFVCYGEGEDDEEIYYVFDKDDLCPSCGEPFLSHEQVGSSFHINRALPDFVDQANRLMLQSFWDNTLFTLLSLRRSINNTVLFLGAGISIPLNIPTWKELIYHWKMTIPSEFYGEFEAQYRAGDVFTMIDYLIKRSETLTTQDLLKAKIAEFIKDRQADAVLSRNDNLVDILNMNISTIVTCNYDTLLEQADEDKVYQFYEILDMPGMQDLSFRKQIIHIHGSVNNPTNMVLTTSDYSLYESDERRNQYREEYQRKLQSLLGSRPILFLGFSGNDQAVMTQIGRINASSHNTTPYYMIRMPGESEEKTLGGTDTQRITSLKIKDNHKTLGKQNSILAIRVLACFLHMELFVNFGDE